MKNYIETETKMISITNISLASAYLLTSVSNYTCQYLLNNFAVRMKIARRAFSHAAPSVLNDLTVDIRRTETFGCLRTALRTH